MPTDLTFRLSNDMKIVVEKNHLRALGGHLDCTKVYTLLKNGHLANSDFQYP